MRLTRLLLRLVAATLPGQCAPEPQLDLASTTELDVRIIDVDLVAFLDSLRGDTAIPHGAAPQR